MTSKSLALLLADLGVVKTHSRPHVSDDNPFSEAHFKTMKYRPEYPDRFGSIQDARRFCQEFFPWYNHQHHHSGLAVADAGHCPLRPGRPAHLETAGRSRCRLPGSSRALRPQTSATSFLARCRLDQSAGFQQGKYSLNFYDLCLILVDTLRSGARRISTFNGTVDGVTRRHRGGSDGLGLGGSCLAPIQLPSGASSSSYRTGTSTTWLHRWAMYSRMSSGPSWSVERWKYWPTTRRCCRSIARASGE